MVPICCYSACTDDSKECDIVVVNWNILLLSSQLNSFPSCCLMLGANYLKSIVNFCPWKKNEAMSFHKKYCGLSCDIGKERGDDTKKADGLSSNWVF